MTTTTTLSSSELFLPSSSSLSEGKKCRVRASVSFVKNVPPFCNIPQMLDKMKN